MEHLLHYVWKHKMFPLQALHTSGERLAVEVVDPGLSHKDAGPDFFNAKIKIAGTLWAGNVEVHLRSSDWYRHRHDTDAAYNNVVLHVVQTADCEVRTADGRVLPQLELPVPETVQANYMELRATDDYPRCHRLIPHLSTLTVHSWMSALLCERLEERAARVLQRCEVLHGDWETAFFITLARNFGFGLNGDSFEALARRLPLSVLGKHRDNPFQIEAFFLGQAGLLQPDALPAGCRDAALADEYYRQLVREYAYLAVKFGLTPMSCYEWKYLRLRPQNFPHLRIVQLARLYGGGSAMLSRILEAPDAVALCELLQTRVSTYWQTHYLFGCPSPESDKCLSRSSLHLLLINTVVPVLYAYGMQHVRQAFCDKAVALLEGLKAENNFIIRQWENCGIKVVSAADSQALIQLKREYCDRNECLRCRFGFEYLRGKREG